jgi:hypothetical protein
LAWRSDQLGLTADNRTIDPWQTAAIILGLAIVAAGIGIAISSLPSERTTVASRTLAGAASAVTAVGWLLMAGKVVSLRNCGAALGCSFSYSFRPARNQFNLMPDWLAAVTLAAIATILAMWGLLGHWRQNDISPRSSVAIYWIGSVVTWVVMVGLLSIGHSVEA